MKTFFNLTAVVVATILMVGCFNPDEYEDIKPDGLIWFIDQAPQTVAADGVSSATVTVKISDKAGSAKRNVTMKTSLGGFADAEGASIIVHATNEFSVTVHPTSVKIGGAEITASIEGVEAAGSARIEFVKAYPEKISVSVDSFVINQDFRSEALLTASLSKENGGKPSSGHPVNFRVTDANGNLVGYFLNGQSSSKTDDGGKARIRFTAGDTNYVGLLKVEAFTLTEAATTITGVTQLYVQKPKQ